MNAAMSRLIGRTMGKANPAPTEEERALVLKALETAETLLELPGDIRNLLAKWRKSAEPVGSR